eukprot:2359028-Amphidinium_carterae.1
MPGKHSIAAALRSVVRFFGFRVTAAMPAVIMGHSACTTAVIQPPRSLMKMISSFILFCGVRS